MALQSVSNIVILGRLSTDPVLSYSGSGQAVAWLNLATIKAWKDKTGHWQESMEWHRISASGHLAEHVNVNLKKGYLAYIDCCIKTRNSEEDIGLRRYTTELVAKSIRFRDISQQGLTQLIN